MKLPLKITVAFVVLAALASVPILERGRPTAAPAITTTNRPEAVAPAVASAAFVDFDEQAAIHTAAVVAYVAWYAEQVHAVEVAAYQAAVDAAIAAQRTPVRSAPSYHPGTTTGDCTGFAIPDYIIMRESGGNSSAYNPSGAYGCAQTLLSHYSSGSCRGLDPYTIEGQRECVNILSAGGTNLNPWSQTR